MHIPTRMHGLIYMFQNHGGRTEHDSERPAASWCLQTSYGLLRRCLLVVSWLLKPSVNVWLALAEGKQAFVFAEVTPINLAILGWMSILLLHGEFPAAAVLR